MKKFIQMYSIETCHRGCIPPIFLYQSWKTLAYCVCQCVPTFQWFKLYLTIGREYFVCIRSKVLKDSEMTMGVPQGAVLSPLIFNIYVKDMIIDQCDKNTEFFSNLPMKPRFFQMGQTINFLIST